MIPSNLLPANMVYFIAGGYAACPALAEDIDVWVSTAQNPRWEIEDLRRAIIDHAAEAFDTFEVQMSVPYVEGAGVMTLKVGKVYRDSYPIHLLVTEAMPIEVINDFDISTHSVALTAGAGVLLGKGWTPINQYPRVLRNTSSTAARMEKIVARYGLEALREW